MPKTNLCAMSVEQLLQLRDDIGKELNRKSTELRSQLARLGGEIASSRGRGGSLKGKKGPPKYRDSAGNTWAGRGAKPRWLVAAIKEGKKLEDFAIEKPAPGRKRRKSKKCEGESCPAIRKKKPTKGTATAAKHLRPESHLASIEWLRWRWRHSSGWRTKRIIKVDSVTAAYLCNNRLLHSIC